MAEVEIVLSLGGSYIENFLSVPPYNYLASVSTLNFNLLQVSLFKRLFENNTGYLAENTNLSTILNV
jgi:hypothetical protein